VKGLTVAQAQAALAAINVFPVVVTKTTTDPSLDGIVYGINPDAGTTVLEGTSVTLFAWAVETPPTPTPTPSPSGTPSPSPSGGPGNGNGNGGGNGNGNGGG
jgi:beta-lactam-binding protein with PASTA domain